MSALRPCWTFGESAPSRKSGRRFNLLNELLLPHFRIIPGDLGLGIEPPVLVPRGDDDKIAIIFSHILAKPVEISIAGDVSILELLKIDTEGPYSWNCKFTTSKPILWFPHSPFFGRVSVG